MSKNRCLNTGRTHFKKGCIPWNKGLKRPEMTGENHFAWKGGEAIRICLNCKKEFKIPHDQMKYKTKGIFCSQSCRGKYYGGELHSNWKGGKPICQKDGCGKIISYYSTRCKKHSGRKGIKLPQFSGKNSFNWKGGVTSINRAIRASIEYEEWRTKVFERDNYTCQFCGVVGEYLNADHIKPFSYFPELRFDINNGRTLCVDCHRKTDTYAGKGLKRIKQGKVSLCQ